MTQVNYGKYLLPEIPVIDGYDYIAIRKDSNNYDLLYSKYQFYHTINGTLQYLNSSSEACKWYKAILNSPTGWDYFQDDKGGGFSINDNRPIIWCNHDILDGSATSSTVWMKGTEPSTEAPEPHAYSTIESIFEQTTDNLTCLVNNTAYDDNAYSISSDIPSWLNFSAMSPSIIYVSGNSWIGLGVSNEQIKFNRRDTKMYYLWTEEGTLFNYYHFYRIRWRGYSYYSNTNSDCLQEWEVLFFDTGDLCIHAIHIPTSYYDGTNNIVASTTYSYAKLTTDSPYVTFYSQDENNRTFTVDQNIINLMPPFDRKYLIRSEGIIYTIVDGVLNTLSETIVSSDLFRNSGVDEIPDGSLLIGLTDPEVLYWMDSTDYEVDKFQAIETATPPAQVLESIDYDMTDPTIKGINSVSIVADSGVLFGISFDSGSSWMMWSGSEWVTITDSNEGMTAEIMNTITLEQWNSIATTGNFRFRIVIPDANNKFTSLVVNYIN